MRNRLIDINHQLQRTAQYLMEHSGVSVTMNTYTHLGFDDAKDEMVRLEELEVAKKKS